MLPPHINQLIDQFTKLPGIGPRQAARFVFYLIKNRGEFQSLLANLRLVDENVDLCQNCYLPAARSLDETVSSKINPCYICSNPERDKNTVCVIEKETDALNMEHAGHFKGHYFVLGGFINPLYPDDLAHKRADYFIKKIKSRSLTPGSAGSESVRLEVILALTPRREGDFTSHYIEEKLRLSLDAKSESRPQNTSELKHPNIKISRLGRGLSSGAELEYADDETLKNAFEGRK